jgi:hypothetical protein
VSEAPIRVIYVAGAGHSGSTLLDVLLASHSRVASVGEIKTVGRPPARRCTCGVRPWSACPFWSEVDDLVRKRVGRSLPELDLGGADPERFARDNRAVFRAVTEVSGRDVVVDSSKSVGRLVALLGVPGLAVLPVHVRRHPAAVAHSHRRKGRSGLRGAWHLRRRTEAVRRALAGREHRVVHYESLVAHPTSALLRVLAPLGLAVEPGQLDWGRHERHNLGGNRMRHGRSTAIRLDREWETALHPLQQRAYAWLGRSRSHAPGWRRASSGRTAPGR